MRREEDCVYSLLSRRSARHDFALHGDGTATLEKIVEYLIRFQERLSVFVFSGQVQRLLALPNHPVVIATSAPVGDFAAAQFAISFFQAFGEQYATIREAFATGLDAAKVASSQPIAAESNRAASFEPGTKNNNDPLWGLYTPEEEAAKLDWKLPQTKVATQQKESLSNQFLLKGLLESLAPYNAEVRQALKNRQQAAFLPGLSGKAAGRKDKNAILKALPFPISAHLQKLLAKRRASMTGQDFYDESGEKTAAATSPHL